MVTSMASTAPRWGDEGGGIDMGQKGGDKCSGVRYGLRITRHAKSP
ncbi:hypothetical protein RLIN73S_06700 [Rhodanobacter lindaniclasticus]